MLAAIGRGYHRQYATEQDSNLGKARAEATDPDPLTPDYPTLFHRLAATAEDVAQHVKPGQAGYQDWYANIKKDFTEKATKAAAAEVDEKWLVWKAKELDRLARTHDTEIAAEGRKRGTKYFIAMASRLGLRCIPAESTESAIDSAIDPPTTTTGKKRTISGSAPSVRLPTPAGAKANLTVALASARSTSSPAATPRGRAASTSTSSLFRMRSDPSPLRSPAISRTILTLSPRATLNLQVNKPHPPTAASGASGPPGFEAIAAAIQAAMGPAIQAAMAPYAAKLDALERVNMPPPVTRPACKHNPINSPTTTPAVHQNVTPPPIPPNNTVRADSGFILIDSQSKKWKGKVNAGGQTSAQPAQTNLTPASYANAAMNAADIQQPQAPRRQRNPTPAITEVTVLRTGGHVDPQRESHIRARAADAIVREVRTKMAKVVAKPIPLRAGRWSIHPRSKGNFVFSFDGCLTFDVI
ncbi:hypothetical protein F5888DRAFT_1298123 [Russula emetica]|nr:hypothetical protein F5888DRAFT_1298123 [Russula emetica]